MNDTTEDTDYDVTVATMGHIPGLSNGEIVGGIAMGVACYILAVYLAIAGAWKGIYFVAGAGSMCLCGAIARLYLRRICLIASLGSNSESNCSPSVAATDPKCNLRRRPVMIRGAISQLCFACCIILLIIALYWHEGQWSGLCAVVAVHMCVLSGMAGCLSWAEHLLRLVRTVPAANSVGSSEIGS